LDIKRAMPRPANSPETTLTNIFNVIHDRIETCFREPYREITDKFSKAVDDLSTPALIRSSFKYLATVR
jgi:hypothetical protein